MASAHLLLVLCLTASCWDAASGHARLISPPSRSSMWRFGFQNPPDYEDNQGFCGGYAVQWEENGGKCGICGDSWSDPVKEHEAGGRFANGIIVDTFAPNQTIDVLIDVTANHLGYFSFKLCPAPSPAPSRDPTQECFDRQPLYIQGGGTKYYLASTAVGIYTIRLHLPALQCERCVLQWTYTTGNNWGTCNDGTGAMGCGPQETFRACADIAIISKAANSFSAPPRISTEATGEGEGEGTEATEEEWEVTETEEGTEGEEEEGTEGEEEAGEGGEEEEGTGETPLTCQGAGPYSRVPGMAAWCTYNCNYTPPYCPSTHCTCTN